MLRTESQIEEVIEPYAGRILQRFRSSFNNAITFLSSAASTLEKKTKAGIIRDFIIDELKQEFEFDSEVQFIRRRGLLLIVVKDKACLRVKKMDEFGRCSNYPTPQALNFAEQLPLSGDGYEDPTHLNLGYVPDSVGMEILEVLVACPNGKRNEWVISLQSNRGAPPVVAFTPVTPRSSKPRVRKKKTSEEKKIDDGTRS